MHDLTAKAAELDTDKAEPQEIGGLNEADAVRLTQPDEDGAASLKEAWRKKADGEREFRRALIGLCELEAQAITELIRKVEQIHTYLERARYY